MFVDKLAASRKEVACLESVTQDLSNQRSRLEESVARMGERNEGLEMELKHAQCREEQLEEELEVTGAKVIALEDTIINYENKVCKLS
jgi:septal ring factor EnvC (AmiA/AmiB activator)